MKYIKLIKAEAYNDLEALLPKSTINYNGKNYTLEKYDDESNENQLILYTRIDIKTNYAPVHALIQANIYTLDDKIKTEFIASDENSYGYGEDILIKRINYINIKQITQNFNQDLQDFFNKVVRKVIKR